MADAGQAYVDRLRDAGQAHVSTDGHSGRRPKFDRRRVAGGQKDAHHKEADAKTKAAKRKNARGYFSKLSKGRRQVDVRADLQARHYNATGLARTNDWMLPTLTYSRGRGFAARQQKAAPKAIPGRGGWMKWTGPAICATAFAAGGQPARISATCEGGGHAHALGCRMFTAALIEQRTDEENNERYRRSLKRPFRHYMTNNMFDETQLYVAAPGGHRAKRRRTMAHQCQITYQEDEEASAVVDVNIVRAPQLVLHYSAETTSRVLGSPTDPCGIATDTMPAAAFIGRCICCDSHAVNKKVAKLIARDVDTKNRFRYALADPPAAALTMSIEAGPADVAHRPLLPPCAGTHVPTLEELLGTIGIVCEPRPPETSITALGDVGHVDTEPTAPGTGDIRHTASHPSTNEPFHVHVASYCSQHKTGTAVEYITKFLGVLSPSFCLASCLANGDVADKLYDAICGYLDRNMLIKAPDELDFDAADEEEIAFQEALLEQCHVQPHQDGARKRRKEADELLSFFRVPWSGRHGIVHVCPAGCCGGMWQGAKANQTRSLERAKALIKFIFMPPVTEPSANKYTKTDPCVRAICLITWTFGLLRKAIGQMLRKKGECAGPADVVEADGAIGVPRDTYAYEKKLGHLKVQKVHTFLSHAAAKELLLVWIVVTAPIMILHYFLFHNGKFCNPYDSDAAGVTVFDFVDDTASNRLTATVGALCSMLMEPTGHVASVHLNLLFLKLGRLAQWPDRVKVALQVSLVLGIAWFWRKVIVHYNSYPWALAPAFSKRRSWSERMATLQAFFRAAPCCLDLGLSRQLRKAFDSDVKLYDGTRLADFLHTVFSRQVLTSTQVELQFAALTAWTHTRNKRLGLHGLAARSMNKTFTDFVRVWREAAGQRKKADYRRRPSWTKLRKERSKTALDLYCSHTAQEMHRSGEMEQIEKADRLPTLRAAARAKWIDECEETRAEFELAAGNDTQHAACPDHVDTAAPSHVDPESPLQLAALNGDFPIEPYLVRGYDKKFGFKQVLNKFRRRRGWYTQGGPEIGDIPEERVCAGAQCCKRILADPSTEGDATLLRVNAHELLDHMRLVLKHAHHQKARTGLAHVADPLDILQFECLAAGKVKYYLTALPQNLQCRKTFEATFFEMRVADTAKVTAMPDFRPTLLKFLGGQMFGSALGPTLATEMQVTAALLDIGSAWRISLLQHRIAGHDERLAISRTVISYAQALEHEATRQAEGRCRPRRCCFTCWQAQGRSEAGKRKKESWRKKTSSR